MKSPITGKEMKLTWEKRSMDFRKEKFEVVFQYYLCEDSGEQFTSTSLDEVNTNQVYNQYRNKYNIPFTDEIAGIRSKYGLSAAKMSEVLGFGTNGYRQYEAGDMPSLSNAKLIQAVEDPETFIEMVESCATLDENSKKKCLQKARLLAYEKNRNSFRTDFLAYVFGSHLPDIYSGYRRPSLEKLTEMVVYFAERLAPFKTKMNKLLFYADFSMFRQSGFSISGVRYRAIEMGPVPTRFQTIFEFLQSENEISIQTTEFPQGFTGEQFLTNKTRTFNAALFSEAELKTLEKIAVSFQSISTGEIIDLSHRETAWQKNEKERGLISYEYAFELKGGIG